MLDDFKVLWPFVSVIVGAVAAYFGALNAMRERMATIEARQNGHDADLREIKSSVINLTDRVNRHLESHK